MKELLEVYKQRVKVVKEMLDAAIGTMSYSRLQVKHSCYRQFVRDLELLIKEEEGEIK